MSYLAGGESEDKETPFGRALNRPGRHAAETIRRQQSESFMAPLKDSLDLQAKIHFGLP